MEGTPSQDPGAGQPSEEEMRARIEEQLKQVRVQDLLVESTASLVNLTARRIAKQDEQDLEQARIGIEAVRALVDLIEGEVEQQVRSALSELQMLYARASAGEPLDGSASADQGDAGGQQQQQQPPPQPPPGQPGQGRGQEPPPRLWTPGRD